MALTTKLLRLSLSASSKSIKNILKNDSNISTFKHFRGISASVQKLSAVRMFTDKHEWVEVNSGIGTIGISHYAQEALGDVVYAQLPEIGSEISKKDECGALESVKAASEVYSPVSGTVVEKNSDVENTPALVNQSCYEKGWLFKVKLTNLSELETLMTEEQYKEFLKTDHH